MSRRWLCLLAAFTNQRNIHVVSIFEASETHKARAQVCIFIDPSNHADRVDMFEVSCNFSFTCRNPRMTCDGIYGTRTAVADAGRGRPKGLLESGFWSLENNRHGTTAAEQHSSTAARFSTNVNGLGAYLSMLAHTCAALFEYACCLKCDTRKKNLPPFEQSDLFSGRDRPNRLVYLPYRDANVNA